MWRPASVLQSNSSDDWDRFKFGEHSNNSANYSWYSSADEFGEWSDANINTHTDACRVSFTVPVV